MQMLACCDALRVKKFFQGYKPIYFSPQKQMQKLNPSTRRTEGQELEAWVKISYNPREDSVKKIK